MIIHKNEFTNIVSYICIQDANKMDWSYNRNRMVSAMERLIEPPKKKIWYEYFMCFRKSYS